MNKFFFTILLILPANLMIAQMIRGKIINERKQPLEFVNVVLYSKSDSAMITGTITNEKGEYSLASEKINNTFLKISFIGYETQIVPVKTTTQVIILKPDTIALNEVVIQSARKTFTMQNGNIVANVAGTLLSEEVNVMEMLRKIPGITIMDGQLNSFIGGKPLIYINGKRVQLISEIQQLQVKNIKSVELNTNPGAEYDATAGAVLLITTQKRLKGLALQIESLLRRNGFWSHDNTLKINYTQNNISFFGQLGYSVYRRKKHQDVTTIIYTPDTTWRSTAKLSKLRNSNEGLPWSLGGDYTINNKHKLGLKYDGRKSLTNELINQPLQLMADNEIHTQIQGLSINNSKGWDHYLNGYYKGRLIPKLYFEIFTDFVIKNDNENQMVSENSVRYNNKQTSTYTNSKHKLMALSPKLRYQITPKHLFSAGAEYSKVNAESRLDYHPEVLESKESRTSENKWAAYFGYQFNNENKFTFNAGSRFEWVRSHFNDLLNSLNDIEHSYYDLFPNIQLTYRTGSVTQNLSYRTGISRPSFNQLNMNTFYINQFLYQEGNPKLVPEKSHSFQYSLMYRFIYFTFNYQHIVNTILSDFQTLDPYSNTVKSTYNNYNNTQQARAILNLQHSFDVYMPSLTLGYMQNFIKVSTSNGMERISNPFGYANFSNDFKFSNGLIFNIEYTYRGAGTHGFLYFKPTHIFNSRVQKKLFGEKLQISISAKDIFGKYISRFEGQVNHIHMSNIDDQDHQSVSLNIVWRFNNYKKTYKGESAAKKEIERL